jgi:hypothetical protein
MKKTYPGAFAFLAERRKELEKWSVTGGAAADQQFYQYGRSQSLMKFNSPKIILPALSLEPRYAFDDQDTMVTGGGNGPYYLVRPKADSGCSLFYLLAVLCHPLAEAMIRTRTSVFGGGYYSHGKQFIQTLPIPLPGTAEEKAIEDLVRSIIQVKSEADNAKLPQSRTAKQREVASLRERIESCISGVFGLTEDELRVVRAVPVPE